mmetsp:Transcript_5969/g.16787  ORF Transcript_5969/g.16787 Transcript_5969/m.16787 type:complete len:223 (-) Transcript_5969:590-1258(-)
MRTLEACSQRLHSLNVLIGVSSIAKFPELLNELAIPHKILHKLISLFFELALQSHSLLTQILLSLHDDAADAAHPLRRFKDSPEVQWSEEGPTKLILTVKKKMEPSTHAIVFVEECPEPEVFELMCMILKVEKFLLACGLLHHTIDHCLEAFHELGTFTEQVLEHTRQQDLHCFLSFAAECLIELCAIHRDKLQPNLTGARFANCVLRRTQLVHLCHVLCTR